ncbi:MAG: hypothetical protein ABJB47_10655 [Actinomycetota bacterium]
MRGQRQSGHAGPLARWERIALPGHPGVMAAVVVTVTVAVAP